jgi:dephospho-CoA kinase
MFRALGAQTIDADEIAHAVINPGSKIYKRIIKLFGKEVRRKNKAINRSKIGRLVFNQKKLLRQLNRIVHPEVIRVIKRRLKRSRAKVIILDAPLLLEAGLKKMVDKLIVVKIDRKTQLERIMRKVSLSKQDILKRIKAQIPLRDKVRLADFVIDNRGRIKRTRRQVKKFWMQLLHPN